MIASNVSFGNVVICECHCLQRYDGYVDRGSQCWWVDLMTIIIIINSWFSVPPTTRTITHTLSSLIVQSQLQFPAMCCRVCVCTQLTATHVCHVICSDFAALPSRCMCWQKQTTRDLSSSSRISYVHATHLPRIFAVVVASVPPCCHCLSLIVACMPRPHLLSQ